VTADPTTRIAQVREQISALTDQGLDSVDIAARLGTTVSRVDQVLDQLEGVHLAALPPVIPPIRHSAGPKLPKLTSIPVPKQEAPAPAAAPAAGHDTAYGYKQHKKRGEKPCDACRDARNAYQRDYWQQKTTARPSLTPAAEPKPKVQVRWLIPRGVDHTHMRAEYAIEKPGGGVQIVSYTTAELHAANGTKILARYISPWVDAG